jgi:drug/metabolite transporter superfamily protein YnfA
MTSAAGRRVAGVVVNIQGTYMEWSSLKTGNQALLCLAGGTVLTLVSSKCCTKTIIKCEIYTIAMEGKRGLEMEFSKLRR